MSTVSVIIMGCIPLLIFLLHKIEARFGSARAGWIASFPVLGAPAILMLSVEHGADFGSEAAGKAVLGMIGWGAFVIWYRFSGIGYFSKLKPILIIFLSVSSWVTCAFIFLKNIETPPIFLGILILIVILIFALVFAPQKVISNKDNKQASLFYRVSLGTFFIILIFVSSYIWGSGISGLLTAFPVISASLMIPTLLSNRKQQVISMSSGILTAGPSLTIFMFTQQWILLSGLNVVVSFLVSLLVAVIVHIAMWKLIHTINVKKGNL